MPRMPTDEEIRCWWEAFAFFEERMPQFNPLLVPPPDIQRRINAARKTLLPHPSLTLSTSGLWPAESNLTTALQAAAAQQHHAIKHYVDIFSPMAGGMMAGKQTPKPTANSKSSPRPPGPAPTESNKVREALRRLRPNGKEPGDTIESLKTVLEDNKVYTSSSTIRRVLNDKAPNSDSPYLPR
jgi:hypothetical protein